MSVAVWRAAFGESRFRIYRRLVLDEPNATHHSDTISLGDAELLTEECVGGHFIREIDVVGQH